MIRIFHSHDLRRAGHGAPVADSVALSYEDRLLRRKRLKTAAGNEVMIDLPEMVSLDDGDALVLEEGGLIAINAAPEPLIRVRGDLARLAWHIGNRHTPCQIAGDHLLIRRDHVLAGMLRGLGADLDEVEGPFTPEGGAYGHGRTMGHDHGHHDHDHDHGHGHGHDHGHGQRHVHHHATPPLADDPFEDIDEGEDFAGPTR